MTQRFDEAHCPRCGARLPLAWTDCSASAHECPLCPNEATVFQRSVYFGTTGSLLRAKRLVEEAIGMHFTIRQHSDCFENGRLRSELSFGGHFLFAEVWLTLNTADDPSRAAYRFVLALSAELEPRQEDALDSLATAIAKQIAPQPPDRPPLIRRTIA